jgi:hypothetical protein
LEEKSKAKRERHHVKIWCSADEKAALEAAAKASGLSASTYLRVLGLGHEPRPLIDIEQARELVRVNGDLGRLGGLLKLWLTDDAKLEEYSSEMAARIIRGCWPRSRPIRRSYPSSFGRCFGRAKILAAKIWGRADDRKTRSHEGDSQERFWWVGEIYNERARP